MVSLRTIVNVVYLQAGLAPRIFEALFRGLEDQRDSVDTPVRLSFEMPTYVTSAETAVLTAYETGHVRTFNPCLHRYVTHDLASVGQTSGSGAGHGV